MKALRTIVVRRVVGVVLLLALTMLRLLTDLGLRPAVATELYLLAVTGVIGFWCFQVLAGLGTADAFWSRAARRPDLARRPDRLEVLEEMVAFWVRTSYGRHIRLRPAVRALVEGRLLREGVVLDRDPRAPGLLGPVTWELVRPDAPGPDDQETIGLTPRQTDELARTLTALAQPDFLHATKTGEQH